MSFMFRDREETEFDYGDTQHRFDAHCVSSVERSVCFPTSEFFGLLTSEFQEYLKEKLKCSDLRSCRIWCKYDDSVIISFVSMEG